MSSGLCWAKTKISKWKPREPNVYLSYLHSYCYIVTETTKRLGKFKLLVHPVQEIMRFSCTMIVHKRVHFKNTNYLNRGI